MSEAFTLRYDATRNRIDFSMHGQWTVADAASWTAAYTSTLAGTRPGFVVVGDMSTSPVQIPEVQTTHEQLMGLSIERGMRIGALVVPAATVKLQLKRLAASSDTERRHIIFVGSVAEAEAAVAAAPAAV